MPEPFYRAAADEDLRPLSAILWQAKIVHRVAEDDGAPTILLERNEDLPAATTLLERWRKGELRVTRVEPDQGSIAGQGAAKQLSPVAKLLLILARMPVTALLIVLSVAGFLLLYLNAPVSWVAALTYEPFTLSRTGPVFSEASGQPWRFLTPAFLHFGWMHIVFNSLWCWELGKRIEIVLGSVNLLGLFLVIAVVSNIAQHLWSGPVLFGGLSGVVYGFLGFAWVAGRLNSQWRILAPATPVMLFMVGWLLICVVGFIDVLGFSVANAAHVGGLLSGGVLGLIFALAFRSSSGESSGPFA